MCPKQKKEKVEDEAEPSKIWKQMKLALPGKERGKARESCRGETQSNLIRQN